MFKLLKENYYWMDRILRSYQSRAYFGDISASFEVHLLAYAWQFYVCLNFMLNLDVAFFQKFIMINQKG